MQCHTPNTDKYICQVWQEKEVNFTQLEQKSKQV